MGSSYALLMEPRQWDQPSGIAYVAARLAQLGCHWRWVAHPMAARVDETLCITLPFGGTPLVVRTAARHILVGGAGVAWGGRVVSSSPVTYYTGHVENLRLCHLSVQGGELIHLGLNDITPLVPLFSEGAINYNTRYVILSTGHGCSYGRCRFCAVHAAQQPLFERDPAASLEVMGRIAANYHMHVGVRTSQDGPSTAWIEALCDAIEHHPARDASEWVPPRWTTYLQANQVTPDLAERLRKVSCVWVSVGAEYLSDSVLRKLKKGTTVARIAEAITALVVVGINPLITLMDLDEVVSKDERQEHQENVRWLQCAGGRVVRQDPTPGWPVGLSDWNGSRLDDDPAAMSEVSLNEVCQEAWAASWPHTRAALKEKEDSCTSG